MAEGKTGEGDTLRTNTSERNGSREWIMSDDIVFYIPGSHTEAATANRIGFRDHSGKADKGSRRANGYVWLKERQGEGDTGSIQPRSGIAQRYKNTARPRAPFCRAAIRHTAKARTPRRVSKYATRCIIIFLPGAVTFC